LLCNFVGTLVKKYFYLWDINKYKENNVFVKKHSNLKKQFYSEENSHLSLIP
jgi:hypothetical protein